MSTTTHTAVDERARIARARLAARTDRLNAIKASAEYASAGEPGRGQEDVYWLIREVDRLRAELGVQA